VIWRPSSRSGDREIVVGLPLELSGEDGEVTRLVRSFVKRLRHYVTVPIVYWDERLSSIAADRALGESARGRKSRPAVIDQVAAVLVLQSYLASKPPASTDSDG
jgi:putative Holliday junction resolvase